MLRRASGFEVVEKRGHGRPNMTWKRQVKEHIDKIGQKKRSSGIIAGFGAKGLKVKTL